MIRVKRLRHTALATSDLEHLLEYYQSVIGLGVINRDGKRVYLGSDSDQLTTVIEQATGNHLDAIASKLRPIPTSPNCSAASPIAASHRKSGATACPAFRRR